MLSNIFLYNYFHHAGMGDTINVVINFAINSALWLAVFDNVRRLIMVGAVFIRKDALEKLKLIMPIK